MAGWLGGVERRDVLRIEIVRVTLEGTPSSVTSAVFRVRLADGRSLVREAGFPEGVVYEALVAEVRDANRTLRRR